MSVSLNYAVGALHNSQYRREGSDEVFAKLRASGIVAVFGASDDLMEFRGAINEELGASTAYVTKQGLVENECDNEDCPHFKRLKATATKIEPNFDSEGYTFTYTTKIPHMTFDVMEDEDKYCRGIVFYLRDVP